MQVLWNPKPHTTVCAKTGPFPPSFTRRAPRTLAAAMSIAANLQRIRNEIADACARAHRDPGSVSLMAVSKVHPAEAILEAHAAGHRLFGENRVQEWQSKRPAVPGNDIEMHLIGPLQNNKTAKAAELFNAVDTLDSFKTAERLNHAAAGAQQDHSGADRGEALARRDQARRGSGRARSPSQSASWPGSSRAPRPDDRAALVLTARRRAPRPHGRTSSSSAVSATICKRRIPHSPSSRWE